MKDLLSLGFLKMLKSGVSNDNYPLYSSYLYSDGSTLKTCNNSVFVSLNYKAPFKGCVNFFVFEQILNLVDDDASFEQEGDQLIITSEKYCSKLNIMSYDFPIVHIEDGIHLILLDEETLSLWRFAIKYAGKESFAPLYVDKDGTLATDGTKIFLSHKKFDISNKLSLSPKILNFVKPEFSLGADDSGNIIVMFNGGFAKFVVGKLDFYLDDRIRKFVDESSKNVKRLIDVAPLRDCAEKLLPIFHGEMEAAGLLSNNKKKLSVSGESSVNGVVSVEIPSELDEKFTTTINLRLLSGVPFNFDVYVNPERTDRIFLSDENGSRIVLMSLK